MPLNIPNLLTWARILLIPLVVGVYYLPLDAAEKNLIATGAFLVAAITDWVDGWLARRLNQTSAFGAFLDPVADKLMVAAALVMLVKLDRAGKTETGGFDDRYVLDPDALRTWVKVYSDRSPRGRLFHAVPLGVYRYPVRNCRPRQSGHLPSSIFPAGNVDLNRKDQGLARSPDLPHQENNCGLAVVVTLSQTTPSERFIFSNHSASLTSDDHLPDFPMELEFSGFETQPPESYHTS